MFAKLIAWIKAFGAKNLIRQLDDLEPFIASRIREAQKKLGEVPPDAFSKLLVDDIQRYLCTKFGVDPKDLGL